MITLNPTEIQTLLNNMARDDESPVRLLALTPAAGVEFADEDNEPFSTETVAALQLAATKRTYLCYSCEERKPISEWTRDSHGVDLCAACMTEAETENEHQDGYHRETPDPTCPMCKAV